MAKQKDKLSDTEGTTSANSPAEESEAGSGEASGGQQTLDFLMGGVPLIIPSILYFVQKIFVFYGLGCISASVSALTMQLKTAFA